MNALEPNIVSLAWFALFWTLCCIGFLVLSGSFPLGVANERGRPSNSALALFNGALMVIFTGLTLAFGFAELRPTTLIVVMGLAFLFAPASFEIWPERWRDGRAVLGVMVVLQLGAIAALYRVGAGLVAPLV